MSLYLDSSVLLSLFSTDALTPRAVACVQSSQDTLLVGDFSRAEFASVCARRVRTGEMTNDEVTAMFAGFDAWIAQVATSVETLSSDIGLAESYLRRLDLTLRAADAVHLAVAARYGATVVTFDIKMAASAHALGLAVAGV